MEQMNAWLDALNDEQRQTLVATMDGKGMLNGHSPSKTHVEILKAPLENYLFDKCPPFVDIHGLIDVYNKVVFRNNLLIKGPKGDGKTLSLIHYCHETKMPLITVECSQDTKSRDLLGTFTNLGQFQLGPIPMAIDIANTCGSAVLVFEELNALTPQIQKVLNAVLDFRKFVTIPQLAKTYQLKEGARLWFVATMNPSVYGGTYDLNEDLRSRWIELEVGYPQHGQEKKILEAHFPDSKIDHQVMDKFIRLASDTRQQGTGYALSTRDLVDAVGLLEVMPIQDVLQLVVCKFEGEDRDTVIKRVSSSFAGIKLKKFWGATK